MWCCETLSHGDSRMHAYKHWRRRRIAPMLPQRCLRLQQCKYRCMCLYSTCPRRCCPVKCHLQRTHFGRCHFQVNHYDYVSFVAQKASLQSLSCQQDYILRITYLKGKHARWEEHALNTRLVCMRLSWNFPQQLLRLLHKILFLSLVSDDKPSNLSGRRKPDKNKHVHVWSANAYITIDSYKHRWILLIWHVQDWTGTKLQNILHYQMVPTFI